MRIWYIHHYAGGPGLGTFDRPFHLGKAWKELGHAPTVFVAGFHHLLQTQPPIDSEFSIGGVPYRSVPSRPYHGNGAGRLLNIWDFSRHLSQVGIEQAKQIAPPHVVIASSPHPFTIFPAYKLARRYGARLVFEIRDIWPLSITAILGTSRLHPFVLSCAFAERFALSKSDLVASVLPRADQYLVERGYGRKPFVWVPNGVSIDDASAPPLHSDAALAARDKLALWKSQDKATVIYAGAIGKPNAVDLLLQGLSLGKSRGELKRLAAIVVGSGDQLNSLRSFASEKGLSEVHFTGQLPKHEALALLKEADIGYAGLRNIPSLFGYGISPNKIADYFQASLPVLLPIAPCGDPVSESGGGVARNADTADAVWEALCELMAMGPEQRRILGLRGRAYMAQECDYSSIARRYIQAIDQLD